MFKRKIIHKLLIIALSCGLFFNTSTKSIADLAKENKIPAVTMFGTALNLSGLDIDSLDGLLDLKDIKTIKTLNLENNPIRSISSEMLLELPELTLIFLGKTRITKSDLDKLGDELPNLDIHRKTAAKEAEEAVRRVVPKLLIAAGCMFVLSHWINLIVDAVEQDKKATAKDELVLAGLMGDDLLSKVSLHKASQWLTAEELGECAKKIEKVAGNKPAIIGFIKDVILLKKFDENHPPLDDVL